jgi:DNA polymerase-3 subunit gamma/tau
VPPLGELDVTELRRHWPRVLEDLKDRRKFAWMTLSQFAQVTDVIGRVLWLTFSEAGARDNFGRSGGEESLRGVIADLLGVELVIRGRTDSDPPPRAEVALTPVGGFDARPSTEARSPASGTDREGVGGADWSGVEPAGARPEPSGRRLRVVADAADGADSSGQADEGRPPDEAAFDGQGDGSIEPVFSDGAAPDDIILPPQAAGQAAEDLVMEVFGAELVKSEEGPPRLRPKGPAPR